MAGKKTVLGESKRNNANGALSLSRMTSPESFRGTQHIRQSQNIKGARCKDTKIFVCDHHKNQVVRRFQVWGGRQTKKGWTGTEREIRKNVDTNKCKNDGNKQPLHRVDINSCKEPGVDGKNHEHLKKKKVSLGTTTRKMVLYSLKTLGRGEDRNKRKKKWED